MKSVPLLSGLDCMSSFQYSGSYGVHLWEQMCGKYEQTAKADVLNLVLKMCIPGFPDLLAVCEYSGEWGHSVAAKHVELSPPQSLICFASTLPSYRRETTLSWAG